jgi:hypothetical protein
MVAGLIGGRALIVPAVGAEAAAFWKRCGFIVSKDDPLILFRSIADIAASFSQAPLRENLKKLPQTKTQTKPKF